MDVDKHKAWLILGISIAVIALAVLLLYSPLRGAVFGKAITMEGITLNCGDTVTQSLTLTESLDCSGAAGDGLIIGADGITLDCADFQILGPGPGLPGKGIKVQGRTGVVIKNCHLSGFQYGIALSSSPSNTLLFNWLNNNYNAVALVSSPNNLLNNNVVCNSVVKDFDCVGSSGTSGGGNNLKTVAACADGWPTEGVDFTSTTTCPEANCNNNQDDDTDGLIDCADPDCKVRKPCDLVAHYRFSNCQLTDESKFGNSAVNNGATCTSSSDLNSGEMFSFDGVDDYLTAGNILDTSKSFSYSVWAKFAVAGKNHFIVIDRAAGAGNSNALYVDANDRVRFASWNPAGGLAAHSLGLKIIPNMWYHLAAAYDAGTKEQKLYVNGNLIDTDLVNGGIKDIQGDLEIGRHRGPGNDRWMNGLIDEVRVYSRALTESEIQLYYNEFQPVFQEQCTDTFDNDGDSLVDCEDPDCQDVANGCEITCDDNLDNDGDGLIDCADYLNCDDKVNAEGFTCCTDEDGTPCPADTICDGGGLYQSYQCFECLAGELACPAGTCVEGKCVVPEICTNGVDDDGDVLVDCADPDCTDDPGCGCNDPDNTYTPYQDDPQATPNPDSVSTKTTVSGIDPNTNLKSGRTDKCIDESSIIEYFCKDKNYFGFLGMSCPSGTVCQEGLCTQTESDCANGLDDDNDGLIDCADYLDCDDKVNAEGFTCCTTENTDATPCSAGTQCDGGGLYQSYRCLECLENEFSFCTASESCFEGKCVTKAPVVLGDTDNDGCVLMQELMVFIGKWKSGEAAMADLMTVIGSWKTPAEGC